MNVIKLGDLVLARRLKPSAGPGKYVVVEWPSFWAPRAVEVGVSLVRRRGSWAVASLEIPEDTPPEDARDIALCSWRVIDRPHFPFPASYAAWGLRDPHVVVAACQARPRRRVKAVSRIAWQGGDFVEYLRGVGPAVCAVVSCKGVVEFDVTPDGFFLDRLSLSGSRCEGARLMRELARVISGGDAKATVCRLGDEAEALEGSRGGVMFVPLRKISSYLIAFAGKSGSGYVYRWEKLPGYVTEIDHCFDCSTKSYTGPMFDRRFTKFV